MMTSNLVCAKIDLYVQQEIVYLCIGMCMAFVNILMRIDTEIELRTPGGQCDVIAGMPCGIEESGFLAAGANDTSGQNAHRTTTIMVG